MNKIVNYLKASKLELSKVVWPTKKQVRDHTITVIVISLVIAAFLGGVDFVIEQFILKPLFA